MAGANQNLIGIVERDWSSGFRCVRRSIMQIARDVRKRPRISHHV